MELDLRETVYGELEAFAGTRGLRLSSANRQFVPTASDAAYLQWTALPVPPDVRGVTNGWSRYIWTIQVDVFVREKVGEWRATEHVDALRAAFPFDHKFVGTEQVYSVMSPLSVAPPIKTEDGWYFFPCSLRVQTNA